MVNNELDMTWKKVVVEQIKMLFRHLPAGTETIKKNLDSRLPGRDSYRALPKFNSGALPVSTNN
jgi:hypothetical protein